MHRYALSTLKSDLRSVNSILQKHFLYKNVPSFFSDGGGTEEPQGISPRCESVKSCLLGQADARRLQMGTFVLKFLLYGLRLTVKNLNQFCSDSVAHTAPGLSFSSPQWEILMGNTLRRDKRHHRKPLQHGNMSSHCFNSSS